VCERERENVCVCVIVVFIGALSPAAVFLVSCVTLCAAALHASAEWEKKDTFVVFRGEVSLVLGHVRPQHVPHQRLEAQLLLRAQLLQDGALLRAGLEVA